MEVYAMRYEQSRAHEGDPRYEQRLSALGLQIIADAMVCCAILMFGALAVGRDWYRDDTDINLVLPTACLVVGLGMMLGSLVTHMRQRARLQREYDVYQSRTDVER